jgi:hypothetical protein
MPSRTPPEIGANATVSSGIASTTNAIDVHGEPGTDSGCVASPSAERSNATASNMPRSTPATMQIHAMTMVHTAPPSTAVSAARHRFEARREIEADVRIEDFDRRAQKIGQGGAQGFGRDAHAAPTPTPTAPQRTTSTGRRQGVALRSEVATPAQPASSDAPDHTGWAAQATAAPTPATARATPPGRPNTPHAAARAAAAQSPPNAMDAPPS